MAAKMKEVGEQVITPVLIMVAIALEVTTMFARNWMEGYYGDVMVVTLCPWRLCHLNCFQCESDKPTIGCFWIQDWNKTGFGGFFF